MSGFPSVIVWILLSSDLCLLIHNHTRYAIGASTFSRPLSVRAMETSQQTIKTVLPRSNSLTYQNFSTPCPIFCFLRPPDHEMVVCVRYPNEIHRTTSEEIRFIECNEFKGKGEIVLGNRQSVRGIEEGTLSKLIDQGEEMPTSAGQLSIHLNLNMVRLDATAFVGLETVIAEVRLLNTVQMHPDTLLNLKHLRSFEIESGRSPILWTHTNESDVQSTPSLPMYIRLQPADVDVPIIFNLQTKCHQCMEINSTQVRNLVVLLANSENTDMGKQYGKQIGFSMIFPQTCPKLTEAPGCSESWDNSETSVIPSIGKPSSVKHFTYEQTTNPSILILLSVWCTILTFVILFIVGIVYWCTRRMHQRKPLPRWIPSFCATQQSSFEDVSLDSSNSGFSKHRGGSIRAAQSTLLNSVLNGSRGSWNSLHASRAHSKSSHSLKNNTVRAAKSQYVMPNQNKQPFDSCRRSIGSQTDFKELTSDANIYSSLQRHRYSIGTQFYQEPLSRTNSQYALSRMRYLNKMDAVYPRYEARNIRYSLGAPSIHDIVDSTIFPHIYASTNSRNPESYQTTLFNTKVEMLKPPPVCTLPPIYPTSKTLDNPASWKNSIQNGSLPGQ